MEAYAEYGAMGVIVLLFIGMIHFLRSTLMDKLSEVEDICIKLIDRWNKSDERIDRKFDDLNKEINSLDNQVSKIEGIISRLNGKH